MIMAMILAHLVGDYILQWDGLALAKSKSLKGVFVHCVIVAMVTWSFSLPFSPSIWWEGVLFISLTHFLVDAAQLWVKPPIAPLMRFTLDQIIHFAIIFIALMWGGFMDISSFTIEITNTLHDEFVLAHLVAYAFITMPAWVLIKFLAYGLIKGGAPNFPEGTNKYIGIMERILITTFVAAGQFLLVPLVTVPRLALEWSKFAGEERTTVYIVELLASIALAVTIGLVLSQF